MKWNKELKFDRPVVLAVDFDGTIAEDEFPKIGAPRLEFIEWVKEQKRQGHRLILWTCRSNNILVGENKDGALDHAVEFARNHGIEFDAVNTNLPEVIEKYSNDTRKVLADYYIDDKSMLI